MVVASVNNASSYIQWQVIRKNSCFIKRQRGIPKLFSTERFNPTSLNSMRYNGLVNKAAVDVQPGKDGKGVVVTVKKTGKAAANRPVQSTQQVSYAKNPRRTLSSISAVVSGYKPAHAKVAQHRASQILRSQKPVKPAAARKNKE